MALEASVAKNRSFRRAVGLRRTVVVDADDGAFEKELARVRGFGGSGAHLREVAQLAGANDVLQVRTAVRLHVDDRQDDGNGVRKSAPGLAMDRLEPLPIIGLEGVTRCSMRLGDARSGHERARSSPSQIAPWHRTMKANGR